MCITASLTHYAKGSSPLPMKGVSGQFFLLLLLLLLLLGFYEVFVLDADSVDPYRMPHSAVSDLGLYCLPKPFLLDTGLRGFKA